jgi:hypothetical protein
VHKEASAAIFQSWQNTIIGTYAPYLVADGEKVFLHYIKINEAGNIDAVRQRLR